MSIHSVGPKAQYTFGNRLTHVEDVVQFFKQKAEARHRMHFALLQPHVMFLPQKGVLVPLTSLQCCSQTHKQS